MSITDQTLQNACREAAPKLVAGWKSQLLDVINGLQAPLLSKLPAVYEDAAFLNSFMMVLDLLGNVKKKEGVKLKNLGNAYYLTRWCDQILRERLPTPLGHSRVQFGGLFKT